MSADVVMVTVDVCGPVERSRLELLRVAVRFVPTLAVASDTVPVNPFNGVTVTTEAPVAPRAKTSEVGSAVTSKSAVVTQVVAG